MALFVLPPISILGPHDTLRVPCWVFWSGFGLCGSGGSGCSFNNSRCGCGGKLCFILHSCFKIVSTFKLFSFGHPKALHNLYPSSSKQWKQQKDTICFITTIWGLSEILYIWLKIPCAWLLTPLRDQKLGSDRRTKSGARYMDVARAKIRTLEIQAFIEHTNSVGKHQVYTWSGTGWHITLFRMCTTCGWGLVALVGDTRTTLTAVFIGV